MNKELTRTFPQILAEAVEKHGPRPALTFVGEQPLTFNDLNRLIYSVIAFNERLGIVPGDRVAILSTNMPNWAAAYFSIVNMGAVVVPLLPDFSPTEIENILIHSNCRMIFVSSALDRKLQDIKLSDSLIRICLEDFSVIEPKSLEHRFDIDNLPSRKYEVTPNQLASIIYTSGTTGKPKGVMLSHENICFTAHKGRTIQPIHENDRFLSVLPLSHTYESTLGLFLPIISGACVYYINKPPTPTVLLPALKSVKPTAMLTVPLIIEKIYHNRIKPALHINRIARAAYWFPSTRKVMINLAGKKLMDTFGGELKFFGIGGAKLSETVEQFLIDAKFPIAIGYGLTETSPLLAGTSPMVHRLQSTGPAMEGVTLKIHNPDPHTGEGEIWAKGPNVMIGYYHDEALTAEVLVEDGWFRTGDLGVFDKDNFLSIKGRMKNVIIGSNGENIYPEEIESVINNFKYVNESLVLENKGKLVALVHFNREEIEARYQHFKDEISTKIEDRYEELRKELHTYINSRVARSSQVQKVINHHEPFQKTATQKIKRFLYGSGQNKK